MSTQEFPDRGALDRSLDGLRERSGEGGLQTSLQQLLVATRDLFGASGAGFMMLDENSVPSSVGWTDDPGRALEVCQEELGEGPCVEALTLDTVIMTPDLIHDDRWPRLSERLPHGHVRALIGVPVRIGGGAVGSLNIYRDQPGEWADTERRALEAYARLLESFLVTGLESREREQLAEQLQRALDQRIIIERAVGAIMAREGADALAAFDQLRSRARRQQRKVADVAADLLSELTAER